MSTISPGTAVKIHCTVQPGPFTGEYFIQVDTLDGPVSGFVTDDNLVRGSDQDWVKGVVREVESHSIVVMIKGSFFTTNGIANIPPQIAMAA